MALGERDGRLRLDDPLVKDPWARQHGLDRIFEVLFQAPGARRIQLSPKELVTKQQVEDCYTKWLSMPQLTDQQMRNYLMEQYHLTSNKASQLVKATQMVCGTVTTAAKEWQRYTVIHMLKTAAQRAMASDDYNALIRAADVLGKYTGLDKEELTRVDWESIVPPTFEPTVDATVLGIATVDDPQTVRQQLEREFGVQQEANPAGNQEEGR